MSVSSSLPIATGSLRTPEGGLRVPGDKSIGHRSLLIGALCDGDVRVTGLGSGGDNKSTARVLKRLGVAFDAQPDGALVVRGVGIDGLRPPADVAPLDCGNSGTTIRLLLGVLAGQPFDVQLVGDESLSRRPMRRVLDPLAPMGLEVLQARDGTYPPLRVRGRRPVVARTYDSPIASAQVKSAVLLAGLQADGETVVREPHRSRDHSERMLAWFGIHGPGDAFASRVVGGRLTARDVHVPGDLSSAAFLLGAALLVPGSRVVLTDVGVNPTRTGFLDALDAMGANVVRAHAQTRNHEPMATLEVAHGALRGAMIGGELAVRSIDELPLLATLAARAEGPTRLRDAEELRVKESDRIACTAKMLRSFGVPVDEHPDGLTVHGDPERVLTPGRIEADGDHRIAMCGALLALVAPRGTTLEGGEAIATSFPQFWDSLAQLGAATE